MSVKDFVYVEAETLRALLDFVRVKKALDHLQAGVCEHTPELRAAVEKAEAALKITGNAEPQPLMGRAGGRA